MRYVRFEDEWQLFYETVKFYTQIKEEEKQDGSQQENIPRPKKRRRPWGALRFNLAHSLSVLSFHALGWQSLYGQTGSGDARRWETPIASYLFSLTYRSKINCRHIIVCTEQVKLFQAILAMSGIPLFA